METTEELLDPALECFVLLAKFLGVPADPNQIVHDRGRGDDAFSFDDLVRVAKKLDLIARQRQCPVDQLPKVPLPALIALAGGRTGILLKIDVRSEGTSYLLQLPGRSAPKYGIRRAWPANLRQTGAAGACC